MTVIDLNDLSVGMLTNSGEEYENTIQIRDLRNGRIYLPNGDLYENNPCYTIVRNKTNINIYLLLKDNSIHLIPKNERIIMG
jgi:hypothetical protein